MALGKRIDSFANLATIQVTETAANTLTYRKLDTGFSLFEKVAWIIHRIEYVIDERFNGTGDTMDVALMTANTRTTIADNATFTDASVIDKIKWVRTDIGVAATGLYYVQPQIVKDFTNLPGGGLIVPPTSIYAGAQGTGCASAGTNTVRFFFTVKELQEAEYWQLVESRRSVSS